MEEFFETLDYYVTYPKINKMIRTVLLSVLMVAMAILFVSWFNTPRSLTFYPKHGVDYLLYDNDGGPKSSNFVVSLMTMSGQTKTVSNPPITYVQDEDTRDYYVTTNVAGMVRTIRVVPIKVVDVSASYTDPNFRYGSNPQAEYVKITVTYADGRTKELDKNSFKGSLPQHVKEYTEVELTTIYGKTMLVLSPATIKDLVITYDVDDVCDGDVFDKRKVYAEVYMDDGFSRNIPNIEVYADDGMVLNGETSIRVNTSYGEGTLVIKPYPLIEQTVEYTGTLFDGDILDPNKLIVTQVFDNGTEEHLVRRSTKWTVGESNNQRVSVSPDTPIIIKTTVDSTSFTPNVVSVDSVEMVQKNGAPLFAGDAPDPDYLTINYSDGTSTDVRFRDVDSSDSRWNEPAVKGVNNYSFVYLTKQYNVSVVAIDALPVKTAVETLQDELANAADSYVSDNMFVTIESGTDGSAVYKLAHVIVNTPGQVKAGLSNGVYGGERETPSAAAKRTSDWVIGINASVFDYDTGGIDRSIASAIIKDGVAMEDSQETASGMETYLDKNGVFGSTHSGDTIDMLLHSGVTDTFASRDVVLIDNGMLVNQNVFSEAGPRTAIGMVKPGEYYLYVASGDGYSGGATYDQVRRILWDHGCVYARCLDGGSSAAMVFKGELVNVPAAGVERAVADYIYFTDVPEGQVLTTSDYFKAYDVEQYSEYSTDDFGPVDDDYGIEGDGEYIPDDGVIIG